VERYPKIETLYDRDPDTHGVIVGQWRLPEFEYLAENEWVWNEKVDGTNIRVSWEDGEVRFGGRTDNAQIPTRLLNQLQDLFPIEKFQVQFPDGGIVLYGEGYGATIQKGGGNYIKDGVNFTLFDVKVGDWWLRRDDVLGVASSLSIIPVPLVGFGTLADATGYVRGKPESFYGPFESEGLVVRPKVDLRTRAGHRLIGKLKAQDFK